MIAGLCQYVTSLSAAKDTKGRDFHMRKERLVEGIPLAEATWNETLGVTRQINVDIEGTSSTGRDHDC